MSPFSPAISTRGYRCCHRGCRRRWPGYASRRTADEIAQREAVVAGDEVDAVHWQPAVRLVKISAPSETRAHLADHSRIAAHAAPDHVTVTPVPLGPRHARKRADVMTAPPRPKPPRSAARARVPGKLPLPTATAAYRNAPPSPRVNTLARSKRKPSTPNSRTQYSATTQDERRHQRMIAVDRIAAQPV